MATRQALKSESHRRIIDAAERLFRVRGFARTGIDAVMRAADLTGGSFYAHFPNKDALVDAVFDAALEGSLARLFQGTEGLEGRERVATVARRYLSRSHRDHPELGCPLPVVLPEVPEAGEMTRENTAEYSAQLIAEFTASLPEGTSATARQRGIALVALMIGGVGLSRAIKGHPLSDEILAACRAIVDEWVDMESPGGRTTSVPAVGEGTEQR